MSDPISSFRHLTPFRHFVLVESLAEFVIRLTGQCAINAGMQYDLRLTNRRKRAEMSVIRVGSLPRCDPMRFVASTCKPSDRQSNSLQRPIPCSGFEGKTQSLNQLMGTPMRHKGAGSNEISKALHSAWHLPALVRGKNGFAQPRPYYFQICGNKVPGLRRR